MSGLRVDIGCGPHMRAGFDVFVDRYLAPVSRHGGVIIPEEEKRFVVADAEALPFRSGTFEYANCANLLEHLEHPGRACEEIQRIARACRRPTRTSMGISLTFSNPGTCGTCPICRS